jgi:hypothetical protein
MGWLWGGHEVAMGGVASIYLYSSKMVWHKGAAASTPCASSGSHPKCKQWHHRRRTPHAQVAPNVQAATSCSCTDSGMFSVYRILSKFRVCVHQVCIYCTVRSWVHKGTTTQQCHPG